MVHYCSEEEARMKVYSVSTRHYYAFGALVSEELSYKIKGEDNSKHLGFFLTFCRSKDLANLFMKLQNWLEFGGSFLIHIWMSRTKIMEVKTFPVISIGSWMLYDI